MDFRSSIGVIQGLQVGAQLAQTYEMELQPPAVAEFAKQAEAALKPPEEK